MLLLLVRHGESVFNAEGRLAGQADVPLSDRGRRQVERLAPLVESYKPDRVLSSDLARARQTAASLGYPEATLSAEWREMDLGAWTSERVATLPADQYAAWRAGTLTPPGGEMWADFCARISTSLDRVMGEGGDTVLISTHGGVVRAVCSLLVDLPPERIVPVNPASLTAFECKDRSRMVAFNMGPNGGAIPAHVGHRRYMSSNEA